MTRVLVVWEDTYCESLGGLVKRLVHARAPAPDAEMPIVLPHTSRGNGGFDRYVHTTWPAIRVRGLPVDPLPIDHLVCVVDGDHLHELLPLKVPRPPAGVPAVAAWHAAAERAWHEHLRAQCDAGGPPETTVHGVVLRWAKESLLLAGYDQPAMEAHLDVAAGHPGVAATLARCRPRPEGVDDALFTDTYRQPSTCLKSLREVCGLDVLHKSAPELDDALRALGRESLAKIRDRVPDLAHLAALVWELHRGPPARPVAPTEADRKERKKKRPVR